MRSQISKPAAIQHVTSTEIKMIQGVACCKKPPTKKTASVHGDNFIFI